MPIPAATIAAHHPWGNAQLAFTVAATPSVLVQDPETGNMVPATTTLEYLAHLELGDPSYRDQEGLDDATYACRGRLLAPLVLDGRIGNGSVASCTLNGQRGRLRLDFNLAQRSVAYPVQRQAIAGTFHVAGTGG